MMKSFIPAILISFVSVTLLAQSGGDSNLEFTKGKQYVITRHDGVEYIGEILNDDSHDILIQSKTLGNLYIPKYEIKSIIEIVDEKMIVNNEYLSSGPFTTRYSFTTNALPIKKGENYGMLNIYGPEAHLALTDNLNIGLMTTWIASPIVLAAKYSLKKEASNVNFSFGSLLGTSGYLNSFKGYGGLQWFNVTLGDRQRNITLSGGYAYLQLGNTEMAPGVYGLYHQEPPYELLKTIHGPIFSVASIFRIGAKASFVFDSMIGYFSFEKTDIEDNYIPSLDDYSYTVIRYDAYATALFLMPGIRFQNTDRRALQICVAGVSTFGDLNESFPIPMISWFYKF